MLQLKTPNNSLYRNILNIILIWMDTPTLSA
jgi:hypothetical protein